MQTQQRQHVCPPFYRLDIVIFPRVSQTKSWRIALVYRARFLKPYSETKFPKLHRCIVGVLKLLKFLIKINIWMLGYEELRI